MPELKKSIGYGTIIALSITSIMGTGLFFGTAIGAKYAGNASIISWAFLSVLSLYIAACFGELVSMFPNAGGVYEFAKRTYGRFPSFMVGWVTWLVGNLTASLMIVAMMKYLIPVLIAGITHFMPSNSADLVLLIQAKSFQIGLSIALIILLNYVAAKGIEASSAVLIFFAGITLTVILTVVGFAIPKVQLSNFTPFIDQSTIVASSSFVSGSGIVMLFGALFMTLFYILETYFGWESSSFLAEETKNPERVIPRGLLITTILTSTIGILVAFSFLGVIPYKTLMQQSEPFDYMARILFGEGAGIFVNMGVVLTLLGSAAGGIVSAPRLLLALARDKLFIDSLAKVSPKTQTPINAIIFQTVVTIMVVIIGFAAYETVLSMLIPMAIFMYLSVLMAIPILRVKMPDAKRYFRVPFGKTGPVLISLLFIAVIAAWLFIEPGAIKTFRLLLSFIFFGIPIYLLLLFHYDPDVVVKLNDIFAYFNLAFERILIPKRIDRSIFSHLGNIDGRHVLEFGCGVGTITKELAGAVGNEGRVIATDVSYSQVRIANKRIARRGHVNVTFIHDIHQVNRVHSSIRGVDAIVSIGMLGYIQDIKKVLGEMNSILPEGGKIFFVDYVDLFKLIPNVSWLSDHKVLTDLFRDAGFAVRVEKIKGKFWNYIYIYGIKSGEDIPFF